MNTVYTLLNLVPNGMHPTGSLVYNFQNYVFRMFETNKLGKFGSIYIKADHLLLKYIKARLAVRPLFVLVLSHPPEAVKFLFIV